MRFVAMVLVACLGFLVLATHAISEEIALFDSEGKPIAYIDTDDELTIYLWAGAPVAYLDGTSIYGFNGEHLGWYENGIIWDHNGHAVGFIKGALNVPTKLQPLKGLKKLKPLKSLKKLAPLKPLLVAKWSATPLSLFLAMGAK